MARASRRWLTGLCSISVVLMLLWARCGERNYWEPAHIRVVRNSEINSEVIIDISGYRSGNITDVAYTKFSKRLEQNKTGQVSLIQPNRNQSSLYFNHAKQARNLQGLDMPEDGKRNAERARVLLMSYMRSGSTFTGDIFQSSPAVFYLYEPLIYVNDDDYIAPSHRPARSRLIPKAMKIPNPPEIHNYTLDTLKCQLTDHNLRFLYALTYSKSTTEFDECQKKLGIEPATFGQCGEQLRKR
ncbi:carbohydrate sulfotransferase [Elysia marginata]|uniref:Carbohydrate sulfotransferase n=1 Tax=Elysia marginata TaxID=1093978 RepID=A0AAV4IE69_9GAST|nr:carbohydrate sulfotransferase [Elysia marginata]